MRKHSRACVARKPYLDVRIKERNHGGVPLESQQVKDEIDL